MLDAKKDLRGLLQPTPAWKKFALSPTCGNNICIQILNLGLFDHKDAFQDNSEQSAEGQTSVSPDDLLVEGMWITFDKLQIRFLVSILLYCS